jgi:hypothetical protein
MGNARLRSVGVPAAAVRINQPFDQSASPRRLITAGADALIGIMGVRIGLRSGTSNATRIFTGPWFGRVRWTL